MSELQGTADHLIVIGRGRLIADASVDELLASATDGSVDVRIPDAAEVMTALANAGGTVVSTGRGSLTVTGLGPERIATLVAERGLRLFEITPRRATLEDVYLELTRDAVGHAATGDRT
jgi:ABC-2 type transport system ATP-binding protein